MTIKMISLLAIAVLALCQYVAAVGYDQPPPTSHAESNIESAGGWSAGGHESHGPPGKYNFKYGVQDSHTGDIKNQQEHSDGETVKGAYSLVEPDGTTRLVEYTADWKKGFNAVVKRIGKATHPVTKPKESHGWAAA